MPCRGFGAENLSIKHVDLEGHLAQTMPAVGKVAECDEGCARHGP
jgi:hypothetical protein